MSNTFLQDWEFSELHMPSVKEALGELPSKIFFDINTATAKRDMKEATDLVITVSSGDIAVRIRRRKQWDYAISHHKSADWSIRYYKHGNETEIHKLRKGFARWYFLGFSSDDKGSLIYSCLIDMDKVRAMNILDEKRGWYINDNHDGTAGMYIPVDKLIEFGCIVSQFDNLSNIKEEQLSFMPY